MSEAVRVVQTEFLTILDGLLAPEHCKALWNHFQMQSFRRIDALGMQGEWLLEDSGVLRGPTVGWGQKWDAQYPTQSAVDDLMEAVAYAAEHFAPTVGQRGTDWEVFSAAATIYAGGQGRLWHRATNEDIGTWVYYAHPIWNVEWGGELFVAHERDVSEAYGAYLHRLLPMTDHPNPPPWKSHLDNQDANDLLMERGIGSYVAPKPNRLVIVKGGTPQAIAKVRPAAGRHVHASVGGVFKKRDRPVPS